MGKWKLANSKEPDGLLSDTTKFLSPKNKLGACFVSIPTIMDIRIAIDNIGGIISADTRSLEIWWNSEKQILDIVLVSTIQDLDKLKQAFYNMYQNIAYEDIDIISPDWFKKNKEYQIFDVGYKHGHFSTVFDQLKTHQTSTQLNNELFEIITGNVGTQFVDRVSGRDGKRFGSIWDPQYVKELENQLATQEYHYWTVRLIGAPGETQPIPTQFWPVFPAKDTQTGQFLENFIKQQKVKYGYGKVGKSLMEQYSDKSNEWLKNITVELPTNDEWIIYNIIQDASLSLQKIVVSFRNGVIHRDVVSDMLSKMVSDGKLVKSHGHKGLYSLPDKIKSKYLRIEHTKIGTAQDIESVTKMTITHYTNEDHFITLANQTLKKGKLMTDLVVYDYLHDSPISVEIESSIEVDSHPEHVKLNMTKWRDLGFTECHIWSKNAKIQEIYDSLSDEEKKSVKVFLV